MAHYKIFSAYHTVDKPWGGANNFLRALHKELSSSYNAKFVKALHPDTNIIFMNQLGKGPGQGSQEYTLSEVEAMKRMAPQAKLVVRAINLKSHAYPLPLWKHMASGHAWSDFKTMKLLKMADYIIFQSNYQQGLFFQAKYKGENHTIIHNGASPKFSQNYDVPELSDSEPINMLASLYSKRESKNQADIAVLSMLSETNVVFAGQWSESIDSKNIDLLGILDHNELYKALTGVHYLVHPAERDICPNAIIEALNMGIPIIYNSGKGAGFELAGAYGIAWNSRDLEGMIRCARENYASLREKLSQKRSYFGIQRAAGEYNRVFTAITTSEK